MYNLSAIFSPNLSRTLSAETKTGGSINSKSSSDKFLITFKDQGPGFKEKNIENIFKRFYSNRPKNFGEHSGLGLNIVKNIIELHKGKIKALNRLDVKGAQIEVTLPKYG